VCCIAVHCLFLLQLTYQQGMAVVLVTALLILATAVLGLRGRLMQLFPTHLVFAMVVGLGLFLTLVRPAEVLQGTGPLFGTVSSFYSAALLCVCISSRWLLRLLVTDGFVWSVVAVLPFRPA
jgi:xanthine/uracil/vitamin C permease (AzgA family)